MCSEEFLKMRDKDRLRLRYGPYHSPQLRLGTEVMCETYGYVRVADYTDGRIPWPRAYKPPYDHRRGKGSRGRRPFILFGDLVRAVQMESSVAVQHWWGVSDPTVTRWRKSLGVPKMNPGSKDLFGDNANRNFTPKIRAKALKAAHCPTAYAKAKHTRLSHPNDLTRRPWTPEEEKLLGTDLDRIIAVRLGRSKVAVLHRRDRLRIPGFGVLPDNKHATTSQYPLLDRGELLHQRKSKNLTLTALSARSGIGATYLGKLEKGRTKWIKPATLDRLCAALKCRRERLILRPPDAPRKCPSPRL